MNIVLPLRIDPNVAAPWYVQDKIYTTIAVCEHREHAEFILTTGNENGRLEEVIDAQRNKNALQADALTQADITITKLVTALQTAKHRLDELQVHYSGAFANTIHKERTAISALLIEVGAV